VFSEFFRGLLGEKVVNFPLEGKKDRDQGTKKEMKTPSKTQEMTCTDKNVW